MHISPHKHAQKKNKEIFLLLLVCWKTHYEYITFYYIDRTRGSTLLRGFITTPKPKNHLHRHQGMFTIIPWVGDADVLRKRMCVANRKRGCNYLINVSIQVDFLVTPGEIAYLCTKTPLLPGQRCPENFSCHHTSNFRPLITQNGSRY